MITFRGIKSGPVPFLRFLIRNLQLKQQNTRQKKRVRHLLVRVKERRCASMMGKAHRCAGAQSAYQWCVRRTGMRACKVRNLVDSLWRIRHNDISVHQKHLRHLAIKVYKPLMILNSFVLSSRTTLFLTIQEMEKLAF